MFFCNLAKTLCSSFISIFFAIYSNISDPKILFERKMNGLSNGVCVNLNRCVSREKNYSLHDISRNNIFPRPHHENFLKALHWISILKGHIFHLFSWYSDSWIKRKVGLEIFQLEKTCCIGYNFFPPILFFFLKKGSSRKGF